MNRNHGFPDLEPEELFDEAVERLESGESAGHIISSYPLEAQDELRDMLMIVQAAENIRQSPVPRPSPAKRLTAKQNFLNAAAEMRQQQQQALQPVAIPIQPRAIRSPQTSWKQRLVEGMQGLFSVRTLRLAPMIIMLAFVLLSTSTLVTMAQTSVPGDLAYSFKQWIRKQELQLAPADRREFVRLEQEQELAEDVKKAAARADDNNSAIIQAEDTQLFYGRTGRLLKVGGLTVMDRYQPNANAELFEPIRIEGELEPGAQVNLVYQIMPGQSDTVQGIALTVLAPPVETPTPEPAMVDVPDVQPRDVACTISQPEDWVPYEVHAGDNLTFMAKRGGTTVQELMQVNCLESETILIGAQLYVPPAALDTDLPVRQCGAELPEEWVEYEVRVGDNLSVLAARGGSTVQELMEVNCLKSETILIGEILQVPEVSVPEAAP